MNVFHKYGIYAQCGFILFDPYTTLEELEENLKYFKKLDFILCKGIFTELYAAEGTEFTNKLLLNSDTGELERHNENYTYQIKDEKVIRIYNALKKWHKAYGNLYDMLIDPLTAPKNIAPEYMKEIYNEYLIVRKRDIQFMDLVIMNVKAGIDVTDQTDSEIAKNMENLKRLQVSLQRIYEKAGIEYDGELNSYL